MATARVLILFVFRQCTIDGTIIYYYYSTKHFPCKVTIYYICAQPFILLKLCENHFPKFSYSFKLTFKLLGYYIFKIKNRKEVITMNGFYENNNFNSGYQPYTQTQPSPKKKGKGGKVAAMALCFSLLGGAIGTGGTYLGMNYLNQSNQSESVSSEGSKTVIYSSPTSTQLTQTKAVSGTKMSATEVYNSNVNSTVGITTSIKTNYFGYETTAAASGSGFIISADGYIVTNHHVIDGANKITVTLYDGKTYDAELIGSDESNDIAVLKIDEDGLTPVVLGSSEALSVGDDVVAIGNPLGELTFSLTAGVVSSLDRTVTTENTTMNLIQTDAAINSGNSGGALFNMNGEVVGITNAKYSSSGTNQASIDNIGFAIPIDNVKSIIQSLIENGYVIKPYIGVSVADVSTEAIGYGLPEGAAVKEITKASPAETAGIEVNDIITEVNGKAVASSNYLVAIVKKASKGDKLECKVYRNGEYKDITITVGETKQDGKSSDESDEQQSQQKQSQQQSPDGNFGGFGGYGSFPDDFFGY